METPESAVVPSVVALGLAGLGAGLVGVGNVIWTSIPDSDAMPTMMFLTGWALLTGAVIVGTVVAVHLVRARRSRLEVALVLATALVVAGVVLAHPLVGSATATATATATG